MLDLHRIIRTDLLNDPTITALVDDKIYMSFSPAGITEGDYPQITLHVDDGPTDSITNDYFPSLQIHIWTKGEAKETNANLITKQILLRIDRKSFLAENPCVFQIWKQNAIGLFESDTQTFHKVITFNVVMEGYK